MTGSAPTWVPQQALVALQVAADGAHHDHGHNAAHDEDDHQAVQDAEPVHAAARHLQVRIPAGRPVDLGLVPVHVVAVHDLGVCRAQACVGCQLPEAKALVPTTASDRGTPHQFHKGYWPAEDSRGHWQRASAEPPAWQHDPRRIVGNGGSQHAWTRADALMQCVGSLEGALKASRSRALPTGLPLATSWGGGGLSSLPTQLMASMGLPALRRMLQALISKPTTCRQRKPLVHDEGAHTDASKRQCLSRQA